MAEAKIEFADRKFARRRDMAAEKLMSPQDRDDAEAELRTAKAELQTATENREVSRRDAMRAFGEPKVGATVRVTSEVQPDKPHTARAANIDRVIDAASGTFVVLLDLSNSALDLPSGVKCKAQFAVTVR